MSRIFSALLVGLLSLSAAGVLDVWGLPIDGKGPYQLTHFTDGRTITDFA